MQLAELQTKKLYEVRLKEPDLSGEISRWVYSNSKSCILYGNLYVPTWKFLDPEEATAFSLRWSGS